MPSSRSRAARPSLMLVATGLVLVLFALSLAVADAAPRRTATSNQASSGQVLRGQSSITPVIGDAATEVPDPSRPEDVNVVPVIGDPATEVPDPSRPEDVNDPGSRTIRR